jgi:hypothetical protein
MKNILIAWICICNYAFTQDSLSVLFIGNSYTYVNDLPSMLKNISYSKGDKIVVDSKTNGGYTFKNHAEDQATYNKVQQKKWDFVVLQGQSQEPAFPYTQVEQSTALYAKRLADSVQQNSTCSQTVFFMTWGRKNGDPQWDSINTFAKMNQRLKEAYMRFVLKSKASMVPVGAVWEYIIEHYPEIELFSNDGSHPSQAGTYLSACAFYAGLYLKPSLGASFLGGLSPEIATKLQQAADEVVLKQLVIWKLRPKWQTALAAFAVSQSESLVECLNESWNATSYTWQFGDGSTSTVEHPSHLYEQSGTYTISLIAKNECRPDTQQFQIQLNSLATISELTLNQDSLIISNDTYGNLLIKSANSACLLTVFDTDGKILLNDHIWSYNHVVALPFLIQAEKTIFIKLTYSDFSEKSVQLRILN